ncbi:MAG: glycine dehydrogenase, partial [Candidatus Acidiferrales bacterium]
GQGLGNTLSLGGPYVGFLATRKQFIRQMPGRIIGRSVDSEGQMAFVMVLQTREQHIRREKATSNICTNQALCALAVTIFLCVYGRRGLRELAGQNLSKAHYLAAELAKLKGVRLPYAAPFFNEFVVELDADAAEVHRRLLPRKFVAGVPLSRWFPGRRGALLLCATETAKRGDLDNFTAALREVLQP